jgi:hypothetical protein
MNFNLRYDDITRAYPRSMIRYRFEFVGVEPLPLPDHVYRDTPLAAGTVELHAAERFLVESVDEKADPPVAVLRKVRS